MKIYTLVIIDNNTELYLWKLLRDLKSSYYKKNNYMWWWMCSLILLWLSFFNIYIYKITMLYTKKWRISCHTNKSGSQSAVIPAHLMWTSEPRGHPGRKISAIQQPSATPQGETWGAWAGERKSQDSGFW